MSAASPSGVPAGGRRRESPARGGLHPLVVLAVLIPLVTGALALGLRQPTASTSVAPPEEAPLTRADRGCPGSPQEGGTVLVADAGTDASGEVELRAVADQDSEPQPLAVAAGATASAADDGPLVVTGREELAPGLLATRTAGGAQAATVCPAPGPETWFAGLGARAEHSSTIELANPDVGAAVVDIDVFTRQGPADVPELRGLRVPGHSSYVIDLAQTAPRRGDLAIRLSVTRGRLAATVRDRIDRLGSDAPTEDWLAPQAEPATVTTLLGLPGGRGPRTLAIANPGVDQARVTLKLVSAESTFAPADLDEVRVRPGSLVDVRLGPVILREVRRGAVGVLVESSEPVVSGLAGVVGGDLVVTPAVSPAASASAVLPDGKATVVLAGASTSGLATVSFREADGSPLDDEQVEVTPGRAFSVRVPASAAFVTVTVERTTLAAAVTLEGDQEREGHVVLALTTPDVVGLVPAVRPADR